MDDRQGLSRSNEPAYNVGNLVYKSCELEFCEKCFDAIIGRESKTEKGE